MMRLYPLYLLLLISFSSVGQSIVVNDPAAPETALTAEELVNEVLLGGDCVSVTFTNLQENPAGVANLAERSWGFFDATGTTFPFQSGIILSSGFALEAEGPNDTSSETGTGTGWGGDPDLKTLLDIQSGDNQPTNNATIFQFEFVPIVSDVTFDFIFASEEYENDFECDSQFRDGFAFLLRGPGIPNTSGTAYGGINIAAVPGSTDVPVSTLSIHSDTFLCGPEIPGVNFFPEFYISNVGANNLNEIQFDGYTQSLTAQATLIPGETYELKMVIADRGDSLLDSAVFFRAGSLDIGSVDLGVDLTVPTGNARCEGETYTIIPDISAPPGTTFEWQYEDPLGSGIFVPFVPAETGPVLDVTTTGRYKIIVDFAGVCTSEGEVYIEFAPPFTINDMPDPLVVCDSDNDGFAEFDLTQGEAGITGGDPDLLVSWHLTLIDAQNASLPIVPATAYVNANPYSDVPVTDPADPAYGTRGVWARVESATSSCYNIAPMALEVRDSPMATEPPPLRRCDDAVADGFAFFDLTLSAPDVLGALDPLEFDLYWYVDQADAVAAGDVALTAPDFSLAIADPTNFLNTSNPQTVWVLVVGNASSTMPNNGSTGCYDVVPLQLIVDPNPEDLGPFLMQLCDDQESGSTTDQVSIFDLTTQDPLATGGAPGLTVTWFASPADEASDIPIADPTAYPNASNNQTVIGRVESPFGCRTLVTLTLTVVAVPTPETEPAPIELCDDDDDGIVGGFDPGIRTLEIVNGEADVSVAYYETFAAAEAAVAGTEITAPYTNTVPGVQTIYARVTRDAPPAPLACYAIVELDLVVVALPDAPNGDFLDPLGSCDPDGDGTAVFDLTVQQDAVLGSQDPTGFAPLTYYVSLADAQVPQNAIDPANAFPSTGQTVWVRLESLDTGCARITPFELAVLPPPAIGVPQDLYLCDGGADPFDGVSTFDLTVNGPLLDPTGTLGVAYYASQEDQDNGVPITAPGAYDNVVPWQQEIFVSVLDGQDCESRTSFFINAEPNPAVSSPTPLEACSVDGNGFYDMFDLPSKDAEIIGPEADVDVAYYETELAAIAGDPAEALASPYANVVPFLQTIYARVTRRVPPGVNPCYTVVPMDLVVNPRPTAPQAPFGDLSLCDTGDGTAVFDLTLNDTGAMGANDPSLHVVTYHESEPDALSGASPIDPANAFPSGGQTIWARVAATGTDCARATPFELIVDPLPVLGQGPFELVLCDDQQSGSTEDQVSIFDLAQASPVITAGDLTYSVFFYLTPEDQANGVPIADPESFPNTSNPQVVYVSVFDGGCPVDTVLTLRVLPVPSPVAPEGLEVCDGSAGDVDGDGQDDDTDTSDGLSFFDLTAAEGELLDGEVDVEVTWHLSPDAAEAGDSPIADPTAFGNTEAGGQTVWARVTRTVPPAELPCWAVVPLQLTVNPLPDGGAEISDVVECQSPLTGTATILLESKDAEALATQDPSGDFTAYYFESVDDAQSANLPAALAKDVPYAYGQEGVTIYVGIMNEMTGCWAGPLEDPAEPWGHTLAFRLAVRQGATAQEPAPYVICDNAGPNDGFADFELAALAGEILGAQDPAGFVLTFHETLEGAEQGTGALADPYRNIANPQVVYARVEPIGADPLGRACSAVVPVTLKVEQLPPLALEGPYRICVDAQGEPIGEVSGGESPPVIDTGLPQQGYAFLWELDGQVLPNQVGPSLTALAAGTYTVTVTQLDTGCTQQGEATVVPSSPPLEYSAAATEGAFAGTHSITVTAQGLGSYVFSLDGGPFQQGTVFDGVAPGAHTVTIADANGCGSVTVGVGVVDYPRVVTPNQDGYHDTWNITGIAQADPAARIYIFDRFGKLLKQISPTGSGWDGTYNGNPLPSSDYWFRVEYTEDGQPKQFTGHFTLKR